MRRHAGRRTQGRRQHGLQAILIVVLRPVHFAHAGVEHGDDALRAMLLVACERYGIERDDGHDGQAGAIGQALRDAASRAHARKRAGAGAVGDGVDVGQGHARFGQQFLHHGQDGLGMGAHARRGAEQDDIAAQQGAGGEFGRRFNSK